MHSAALKYLKLRKERFIALRNRFPLWLLGNHSISSLASASKIVVGVVTRVAVTGDSGVESEEDTV